MSKNELQRTPSMHMVTNAGGAQSKYLASWADKNRDTFEMCMEKLADELPQKYCELFVKISTLAAQSQPKPQQTNIDTMNVNVTSKLDALSDVHDTSWRNANDYTNYEEVQNEK